LYNGLITYLINFIKERGHVIQVDEELYKTTPITPSDIAEYSQFLNLRSRGQPISPRDYQLFAFYKAIKNKRMLMLSPTASGKSLIIYMICRFLFDYECKKGLLIVPTVSLVEQMYGDFEDYSTHSKWNVIDNCQKIYSGYDKIANKPLTISTWQSIYDQPEEFFEQFDFVIGDEAHTFKAQSLAKIMTQLKNTKYRIGTTGTIDDVKVHKLTLEAYFGPVTKIITTKELIDRGSLSDFEIKCLVLTYPKNMLREIGNKKINFQKEIDFIVTNQKRNKFITELAMSLEGNTLILFQFVDRHGRVLHEMINSMIDSNRKVFFISGDVAATERDDVRKITETQKDAIIVASYGTFSTGVSIRNLHNIIFASPSKSKIRNLQSIGRGLRLGENKKKAVLYDIIDDLRLSDDDEPNYALQHYAERMKIYHAEKFKITTHKIGMKE
jgi:superfamily II DNA or RNA helicase